MRSERLVSACLGAAFVIAVASPAMAQSYQGAKRHHSHDCDKGTFRDPRNGGECWSCPAGYGRTGSAVTASDACGLGTWPFYKKRARATFHRKVGCSPGTFLDIGERGCWSCPAGYVRTVLPPKPIWSAEACVRKGTTIGAAISKTVTDIGKEIRDTVKTAGKGLEQKARELRDEATRKLRQFGGNVLQFADKMADGIKEGFTKTVAWTGAAFDKAKEFARASMATLAKAAENAFNELKKFGKDVLDKIVELVSKAVATILEPITGKGRLGFRGDPPNSAWASLRRQGLTQCQESGTFLGIPLLQIAVSYILESLKTVSAEIALALRGIANQGWKIFSAIRAHKTLGSEHYLKLGRAFIQARKAGVVDLIKQTTLKGALQATGLAAVINTASFVVGYPAAHILCLPVLDKWRKQVGDRVQTGGEKWWEEQLKTLRPDYQACYEREFLDQFSSDFVWESLWALAIVPILDVPLFGPLSIQVGALTTAAVTSIIASMTVGTGAILGPVIGTIVALAVRVGLMVSVGLLLKQTDFYKKNYVQDYWPTLRPFFKTVMHEAVPFFLNAYLDDVKGARRYTSGVTGRAFKWNLVDGRLKHVAVGDDGTTWGVNADDDIFRYEGGNRWNPVSGKLIQISVGDAGHVWGVSKSHDIFRREGSGWKHVRGKLKHVSVGEDGTVWGVNANDDIFRYQGGDQWEPVPGKLKQISVGSASHVWGVNSNEEIFRWSGTFWQQRPGKLKYISVNSAGVVWGVNRDDVVFRWSGTQWIQLQGGLRVVSSGPDGQAWGVNPGHQIWRWAP